MFFCPRYEWSPLPCGKCGKRGHYSDVYDPNYKPPDKKKSLDELGKKSTVTQNPKELVVALNTASVALICTLPHQVDVIRTTNDNGLHSKDEPSATTRGSFSLSSNVFAILNDVCQDDPISHTNVFNTDIGAQAHFPLC